LAEVGGRAPVEFQDRAARLRPVPARRAARPARRDLWRAHHLASERLLHPSTGDSMKLYGFWRSLATYRVRVALALKGVKAEALSINLLQGKQHDDDYKAVNPQCVVPALVIDDGPPLFQSLAIVEYLEEIYPEPPLLPKDSRGRARVRGLSMIVACDAHPLIVPRIRNYLEREMHQDEATRNRWLQHWTSKAVEALEAHLA